MDLEQLTTFVGLVVLVLGAIGSFIAIIVNAKKTNMEALLLKDQQKELRDGQKKILSQFENNGGSTLLDKIESIERKVNETRTDLATVRTDVGRLSDVDLADRQTSEKQIEKFYVALTEVQNQLIAHVKDVPNIMKQTQENTLKLLKEQVNDIKQ